MEMMRAETGENGVCVFDDATMSKVKKLVLEGFLGEIDFAVGFIIIFLANIYNILLTCQQYVVFKQICEDQKT